MAEDLLDDRSLQDGRDDLQFPGAAVRAVLHVDVEDPLEQPRPADAVRSGLDGLDLAPGGAADGFEDGALRSQGPRGRRGAGGDVRSVEDRARDGDDGIVARYATSAAAARFSR